MINQLEEIKDTLFKYFETRLDILKIETRDKIERAMVQAAYGALLLSIALVILILAVILLGVFLNKWMESDYLGYVVLLAFFVIKLIVWLVFREKMVSVLHVLILKFMKVK